MKKKIAKTKILKTPKMKKVRKGIGAKGIGLPQKQGFTSDKKIGLHNLKAPKGYRRRRKILGRGPSSGHGKTSTRGSKGQTSRAGRDFYPGFEGGQMPLIRKIPKRGFRSLFKKEYQILNLEDLNRVKEPIISLELLQEKGLIKSKDKLVKILGDGEIKNPITIQTHAISKNAAKKIENAGGKIEIISPAPFSRNLGVGHRNGRGKCLMR